MILVDTNLLTRMVNSGDPRYGLTRSAIHKLIQSGERLVLVPQNFYEFWAVATRRPGAPPSGQNGLGMTPARAGQWLRFFQRRFTVLADREELVRLWQALVEGSGVIGFKSHDVRLVAAMQSYGITRLLSFNPQDFRGMPVTTIDPGSV